jgi:hypothetical protein
MRRKWQLRVCRYSKGHPNIRVAKKSLPSLPISWRKFRAPCHASDRQGDDRADHEDGQHVCPAAPCRCEREQDHERMHPTEQHRNVVQALEGIRPTKPIEVRHKQGLGLSACNDLQAGDTKPQRDKNSQGCSYQPRALRVGSRFLPRLTPGSPRQQNFDGCPAPSVHIKTAEELLDYASPERYRPLPVIAGSPVTR